MTACFIVGLRGKRGYFGLKGEPGELGESGRDGLPGRRDVVNGEHGLDGREHGRMRWWTICIGICVPVKTMAASRMYKFKSSSYVLSEIY